MTIEETYELCVLYEKLKSGNRNCKDINKVYNTIPKKSFGSMTKNKKIEAIKLYFETLADETLKAYLIQKQNTEENGNIQENTQELSSE